MRELFGLYQTTTNSVLYLPCEMGGLGLKKISDIYITTRIAFLLKMLNHEIEHFRFIARTSLSRDMKKRGVPTTNNNINNFLGYQLKQNGFLNIKRKCGSSSDWMELSHYVRSLGVEIKFTDNVAAVIHNNVIIDGSKTLQKRLFKITTTKRVEKAKSLVLQGNFIMLPGIVVK